MTTPGVVTHGDPSLSVKVTLGVVTHVVIPPLVMVTPGSVTYGLSTPYPFCDGDTRCGNSLCLPPPLFFNDGVTGAPHLFLMML